MLSNIHTKLIRKIKEVPALQEKKTEEIKEMTSTTDPAEISGNLSTSPSAMPSNTASILPPPSIASVLPSSATSSIVDCQSTPFRVSDLFMSLSFVFQRGVTLVTLSFPRSIQGGIGLLLLYNNQDSSLSLSISLSLFLSLSYIDAISADISNYDHDGKSSTFGNLASHTETRSSSSPPLTSKSIVISATCLFCSAIPTLLALMSFAQSRDQEQVYILSLLAIESLEKLLDVTREELPDTLVVVRLSGMEISDLTMANVRLSGMEISDLTMELSDLGQEITQGVKSSTRAVRLAEERLRRLTNMNPSG
uniref:Uncharacterized protein n=1 Tax=Lactuca sativa TaxID=4236 RepID=A0A9R1V6B4_LACSA|nr:hypothetical protein LSAT_V11C600302230 [Lactuca sativa]